MSNYPDGKRITFAGVRNASTTAAWNLSPGRAQAYLPPLPLRPAIRNTPNTTRETSSFTGVPSPIVSELDSDVLDNVSDNLSALLNDIDVLRIFTALDEMPFALLDALHAHLKTDEHLTELQICIQSSLRTALDTISKNLGLKRGLKQLIRKWAASDTMLKFHFLRLQDDQGPQEHMFSKYHEVNLQPALNGLGKGPVVLDGVLSLAEQNAWDERGSAPYCASKDTSDEDMMDVSD